VTGVRPAGPAPTEALDAAFADLPGAEDSAAADPGLALSGLAAPLGKPLL
jgi:hypothetical protein